MPSLKYIPLNKIRQNKVALRDVKRESEGYISLVGAVRSEGVLSPISVREQRSDADDKEYELIDGLQRFTAATEVGTGVVGEDGFLDVAGPDGKSIRVGLIPAQVLNKTEDEVLRAQIIANAHKIETRPVEYAKAMIRILGSNPTMTQSELAAQLSKTPQWIAKNLGLAKINDKIQPLIDDGKIPLVNAYVLAKLPPDEQDAWADRAQSFEGTEFGGLVQTRLKEIKEANRKGVDVGEEKFTPVIHLKKKQDIELESETAKTVSEIIRENDVLAGLPSNASGIAQAAQLGAKMALKWVLSLDPRGIEEQRQRDDARRKASQEEKQRHAAERAVAKEAELTKKLEEVRKAKEAAVAV